MQAVFNDFRRVKAVKKVHKCEWCHTAIQIGEPALNFVGHWEGEFQNWYIHPECQKPMDEDHQYQDDGSICPGPHNRGGQCKC